MVSGDTSLHLAQIRHGHEPNCIKLTKPKDFQRNKGPKDKRHKKTREQAMHYSERTCQPALTGQARRRLTRKIVGGASTNVVNY